MSYKLYKNKSGQVAGVLVVGKNISIPADTSNSDYLEYLDWVAQGNVPDPPEGEE